jgi:hypothetical protein
MRFLVTLLAVVAFTAPAVAQQPASTAAGIAASAAENQDPGDYPVSLDRIRAGLRRVDNQRLLHSLQLQPTFKISVEEQDRINQLMSKLEIPKPGPRPGNGWYGYEQQRQLFNPTDRPLQQPYAAFSGGQLVTVALENLIGKYAGKKIVDAVQNAGRSRAETAAQQEVQRSIGEYCDSRSDRDFIQLCSSRER